MSKEHKHPNKHNQSIQPTITSVPNPFVPQKLNVHQHPQTNLHIKQSFFQPPQVNIIINNNKDNQVHNHQNTNGYGKKLY